MNALLPDLVSPFLKIIDSTFQQTLLIILTATLLQIYTKFFWKKSRQDNTASELDPFPDLVSPLTRVRAPQHVNRCPSCLPKFFPILVLKETSTIGLSKPPNALRPATQPHLNGQPIRPTAPSKHITANRPSFLYFSSGPKSLESPLGGQSLTPAPPLPPHSPSRPQRHLTETESNPTKIARDGIVCTP